MHSARHADLAGGRRADRGQYVEHYNQVRLHSAIGYVAPAEKLAGREAAIFAARDRKLAEARERRRSNARQPVASGCLIERNPSTMSDDLGGG